jgi:hypothetical protein
LLAVIATATETTQASDGAQVASHNDVVYLSPARQGWEGLPLGNGRLGAQAWHPDGLMFQLNTPLSGVYGGALCRVRLRTTPGMLTGLKDYRQRLSLGDATLHTDLTTDSGRLSARCWIPAGADALVIESEDDRTGAVARELEIQTWRTSAVTTGGQGEIMVSDRLKLEREPDYRFAVACSVDGAAATAERSDAAAPCLRIPAGRFTAWVVVAACRDDKTDVVAAARQKLAALRQQGLAAVRQSHVTWWSQFWDKSFLQLSSKDGVADYVANLWYLHVYAMGAGSRGEVPPKFNGGLWTEDRDQREWGPAYWHWNTQETYWPLYAANHLELLAPYLDMYEQMLPAVKKWTKATWETDGAQYQETIPFNGAMGVWEKRRGVHPRLPVPKNVAHTNLILSSSAEIAMQFWWVYLYTGDEEFLRRRAYPLMKEIAAFYVAYLEKDSQGRYNIYPSNAHETFWEVKNPASDLAALRYFLPSVIEASRRVTGAPMGTGTDRPDRSQSPSADAELRRMWQDRLEHLAPFAIDPDTGGIRPYDFRPGEKPEIRNAENAELFAVGVFPLITLDSPDYALGVRTFRARRNVNGYGWTTDSICAARLGLAGASDGKSPPGEWGLQQLLPNHAERYQDHPSGLQDYYGRKPAIHPYLEGSGTMATGIGEMLLQSWNGLIRVAPALPKAWSADFKLLAMNGLEVTARAEQGQVRWLSVLSQRGQPAEIVNPFGGFAVVTCDGAKILRAEGPRLRFATQAGRKYVVLPVGGPPLSATVAAARNERPKRLSPTSPRWIGKPAGLLVNWRPPAEPNAPQPPSPLARVDRPISPEITVPRFAQPPQIDGDLSEAVWRSAVHLGPLVQVGSARPATERTEVLVGVDDKALYVAITCWESRMDGLMVEYLAGPEHHDAPVFDDDSVEIHLRPSGSAVWRLAVNALGAMYDARLAPPDHEDHRMNPRWKAATSRKSNRWIVEAALDLASLTADAPQRGDAWGLNVVRNEYPRGETSVWAPLPGPRRAGPIPLGRLVFAEGPTLPPEKIGDPDLLGHWTCDDVDGVWLRDASGHRRHGRMTAAMRLVDGRLGKALEFTGAGFVDFAEAPDLNLIEAMTLALWIRPQRVGSMRLLDKGPVGGSDGYLLDTHPENHLRVITRPGTLMANERVPCDQWSHVAATFGDKKLRVYLNGREIAEMNAPGGTLTATALPLRVGADSSGGSRFVGLMDDVRIYRRVLKPEEIAKLAAAGR